MSVLVEFMVWSRAGRRAVGRKVKMAVRKRTVRLKAWVRYLVKSDLRVLGRGSRMRFKVPL